MKQQVKIKDVINPFKKKLLVSSDKSISIRCILMSAIAVGKSKIYNLLESEDVKNALNCIGKLGVKYIKKKIILKYLG